MFVKFHLPLLYYSKYLDTFGGNLKIKKHEKNINIIINCRFGSNNS
jgi:hypothetical protein